MIHILEFKAVLYLYYTIAILLFFGLSPDTMVTVSLLLFGYVGILTHYLKKWSEKAEREEAFYIKRFIPSIILSIVTTSVLIILRKELESLYVFTKFSSFVVGYFGNSWFFGFIEQKMSNIKPVQYENEISESEGPLSEDYGNN